MDEQTLKRAQEACRRLQDQALVVQYAQGAADLVPEAWRARLGEIAGRGQAMRKRALRAVAAKRGMKLCGACGEEVLLDALRCKHCGNRLAQEAESDPPEQSSS